MTSCQPARDQAPVISCHQAVPRRRRAGAPLAPAGQRPAAADRDHLFAGHRVAAVGQRRHRADVVAAAAQHGQHRDAVDLRPALAGPRPRAAGAPRRPGRRRGGAAAAAPGRPIGPLAQRSVSSSTSSRSSPRTRMWSSSPSCSSVEPRGGIAWPSRTITLTSASRGSSRSRTRCPAASGALGQPEGDHVAAHLADPPRLEQAPRQRRLVGGQAQPLRQRLEARPLDQGRGDDDEEDDRELFLAAAHPGDDREGRQPDRRRPAQPGPAEHHLLAHVERRQRRRQEGGDRPGDEDQHRRERQPLERDVAEVARGRRAGRAG